MHVHCACQHGRAGNTCLDITRYIKLLFGTVRTGLRINAWLYSNMWFIFNLRKRKNAYITMHICTYNEWSTASNDQINLVAYCAWWRASLHYSPMLTISWPTSFWGHQPPFLPVSHCPAHMFITLNEKTTLTLQNWFSIRNSYGSPTIPTTKCTGFHQLSVYMLIIYVYSVDIFKPVTFSIFFSIPIDLFTISFFTFVSFLSCLLLWFYFISLSPLTNWLSLILQLVSRFLSLPFSLSSLCSLLLSVFPSLFSVFNIPFVTANNFFPSSSSYFYYLLSILCFFSEPLPFPLVPPPHPLFLVTFSFPISLSTSSTPCDP